AADMSEEHAKLEEMVTLYKQGLLVNPKDARKRYQLAAAYEKLGKLEPAIREYEQARKLKSDHFGARDGLGRIYFQGEQLAEAVAVLKEAVAIKPEDAGAQNLLGLAALKVGDAGTAAAAFLAVTRIEKDEAEPAHPDAPAQGGEACVATERWEDAVECFERALALRPNDPALLRPLGRAYNRLAKWEQAKRTLKALVDQQKSEVEGWKLLGEACMHLGDDEESIEAYRRALDL